MLYRVHGSCNGVWVRVLRRGHQCGKVFRGSYVLPRYGRCASSHCMSLSSHGVSLVFHHCITAVESYYVVAAARVVAPEKGRFG
jgi:hypothetical protein